MKYPKINGPFKRDEKTNKVILGNWTQPEFDYLKDCLWCLEEKIDGTNIRVELEGGIFSIKGRTDEAKIPPFLQTRLEELFQKEKVEAAFSDESGAIPSQITLFGEGVGLKINKGAMYTTEEQPYDFILFDVRVNDWWLKREDVYGIADKLGIRHAYRFADNTLADAIRFVQSGQLSFYDHSRFLEGLVARPLVELQQRGGGRIICKIKTKDLYTDKKVEEMEKDK